MVCYKIVAVEFGGQSVPVAVGRTYNDEVALLEEIGVTVLPGPRVYWPRKLQVQWLPESNVCFVGKPDGSCKVRGATTKTPFVEAHHTWALW
jgi:type II secretory pathway component PulJ